MPALDATTRGQLAIIQAAQAVATFYGEQFTDVITDAAGAFGAASLDGIHPSEHKNVLTYLGGRLSLPG